MYLVSKIAEIKHPSGLYNFNKIYILLGGQRAHARLQEVAKVMVTMFHHEGFLDVTPTDFLAGLILVRLEQKDKERMLASETAIDSHDIDLESASNKLVGEREENSSAIAMTQKEKNIQNHGKKMFGRRLFINASDISTPSEILKIYNCCIFSCSTLGLIGSIYFNPITGKPRRIYYKYIFKINNFRGHMQNRLLQEL